MNLIIKNHFLSIILVMTEAAISKLVDWIDTKDENALLDLSGTDLLSIPILPTNVRRLDVSNNNLEFIFGNDLPPNLEFFNCSNNNISNIFSPPDRLKKLVCSNNKIVELEPLNSLEFLDCSNNNLKALPRFDNLKYLDCSNNQISELIFYPKLELLHGEGNLNPLINIKPVPYAGKLQSRVPEVKINELEYDQVSELGSETPHNIKYKHLTVINVPKKVLKNIPPQTVEGEKYTRKLSHIFTPQFQYLENIDENLHKSLYDYTSTELTYNINNTLVKYEELKFDSDTLHHYENIKRIFKDVPPLTEDVTVYRGVRHSEYITARSFLSTSLREDVAREFSHETDAQGNYFPECALLIINVCKGSKVLPLWKLSRYPKEYELLLEDGGKLTVVDVKNVDDICKREFTINYFPSYAFELSQTMSLDDIINKMNYREMIKQVSDDILSNKKLLDNIYHNLSEERYLSSTKESICDFINTQLDEYKIKHTKQDVLNIYENYINNLLFTKEEQDILNNALDTLETRGYIPSMGPINSETFKLYAVAYYNEYRLSGKI